MRWNLNEMRYAMNIRIHSIWRHDYLIRVDKHTLAFSRLFYTFTCVLENITLFVFSRFFCTNIVLHISFSSFFFVSNKQWVGKVLIVVVVAHLFIYTHHLLYTFRQTYIYINVFITIILENEYILSESSSIFYSTK